MAKYRKEEIKAGLTIFVSLAILFSFVLLISQRGLTDMVKYKARFEYVRGMDVGALVAYAGMKAGTVRDLKIAKDAENFVEVTFEVPKDVPIREGSIAAISTLGLMGESYIEITPGDKSNALLKPGTILESLPTGRTDELMRTAGQIADRLDSFLKHIDEVIVDVADEDSRQNIKLAIEGLKDSMQRAKVLIENIDGLVSGANKENIEAAMAGFRAGIDDARKHVKDTLVSIEGFVNRLDGLVKDSQDDLKLTVANMRRLTDNLDAMASDNKKDIRATVRAMKGFVAHLEQTLDSNRGNIDETMVNIRDATHNGKEFADKIKRAPWKLVWPGSEEKKHSDRTIR